MHRLHAVVRGRVQGVGFRYFVARQARSLGLLGWVRNMADGAVEVEAEGPRALLDALLEELRHGPPGARVSGVHPTWSEGEATYRRFEVTD
jgi:acylphosphatase